MTERDDAQSAPAAHGPSFWRSLEEYADSPEFREALTKEFPDYDPETLRTMSRRHFLQLAGASMALAGLTLSGCRRWPEQKLAPFAERPEGRVPGQAQQYATAMEQGGVAQGLLARSMDGRPIKLEGNPQHPIAAGASGAQAQASILQLYDPDRTRSVVRRDEEGHAHRSDWPAFERFAQEHFGQRTGENSGGIAVLAEPSSSGTRAGLAQAFRERFPQAGWYEHSSVNRDNAIAGAVQALGEPARPQYQLDQAKVIACFDADLLCNHPAGLKHARDWAKGRRSADHGQMNRLYAAESRLTVTGTNADERLPVASSKIPALIKALAARLGVSGGDSSVALNGSSGFVETLAKDLKDHAGQAVVAVGDHHSPAVHALVWAINQQIQAPGNTLTAVAEPNAREQSGREALAELTSRLKDGQIETLVILASNPVYEAPADVDFAGAVNQAGMVIHLGMYEDETANHADWHLPQAHYLEAWGDARAWDGTRSIQQPLILPLFGGRSQSELLATLVGTQPSGGDELVKQVFHDQGLLPAENFEGSWRKALHDGVLPESGLPRVGIEVREDTARQAAEAIGQQTGGDGFELVFWPDESLYDGQYANNGWLQELPDPVTKVTWDNPALMNVAEAQERGLESGQMIRLTVGDRSLEVPVYLAPGQARGSIALKLGYGRSSESLQVGREVGFAVHKLRVGESDIIPGAGLERAGGSYALASTQNHYLIDQNAQWGRRTRTGGQHESGLVVRDATLDYYRAHPDFAYTDGPHPAGEKSQKDVPLQLYEPTNKPRAAQDGDWPDPAWETEQAKAPSTFNSPHAWGMTIDMNSCIGCSACVVACQAENNIPVVGKEQVIRGREMHWLRIDRYFKSDPQQDPIGEDPEVVHQPMMCVHCENAPCEEVCPVAATVHDTEGLNVMVYNRCIGTRYCSNNCPYKVRRFNWFDFHSKDTRGAAKPWLGMPDSEQRTAVDRIRQMVFNPDVTVRMRGVMEKCTYCIQRIKGAQIEAKNAYAEGERPDWHLQDGEVVTACQQACPTQAITFGNLNQVDSAVAELQRNNRSYGVLKELNTRPRTMHLAKIRNPAGVEG